MNSYLVSTGVFLILWGLLWTKKDLLNFLTKVIFIAFGIWGLILYFISTGYVIRK